MRTKLSCMALFFFLLAGCGPKNIDSSTAVQPDQPMAETAAGETAPAAESDDNATTETPGPEGEADKPAGESETASAPAGQETSAAEMTSASETEVKPMVLKNFDVKASMSFSPVLSPDKKKSAMEKIGQSVGRILECYKKLLPENPNLEGEIDVTFMITPEGKAKSITFESNSTGSSKLEDCVRKNIKKLKFAKKLAGKKKVEAKVPMMFVQEK